MPRKPRIEYPGAIYHVMSRGNRQEPIYLDDRDCGTFIDTLGEACTKTGWQVHAFVLMGNHYHLLLETPEANLVAGMKWLQGTYTQRFNARHKLWGHLLQGRYKAMLVDPADSGYFPAVASYIHLNPARAKLIDRDSGKLSGYRWSSYPPYLRPSKRPDWLAVDRVLGSLGVQDDRKGLSWYRRHMEARAAEVNSASNPKDADDAWQKIRRGWYLGSNEFRDELMDRLDGALKGAKRNSLNGQEMRCHDEAEAEKLLAEGLDRLGLEMSDLAVMPKGAAEKAVLAWCLRKRTTVGRAWIAQRLVMGDESRVTKLVGEVERDGRHAGLRAKINNS